MIRVKRGITAKKRHKKVLKMAKGYYGARSKTFRVAKQAVIKSAQYAYQDRKKKKGLFRRLWITRINAAARSHKVSYSQLIYWLKKINIIINRKILSEIALYDKQVFSAIINKVKKEIIR